MNNPTDVLQFGEGNFLRAFMEDMIQHASDKIGYKGRVAIVKPRPGGSLDVFRKQNNEYHLFLRGQQNGKTVDEFRKISVVDETFYGDIDYSEYLKLAESEELKIIVSNTTEAGIVFDETDSSFKTPPKTYPGKITAFLYHRFCAFAKKDGISGGKLVVLPMELNENNGSLLREYVCRYATLWGLPERFTSWLSREVVFCNTLVDRIVSGYPENEAEEFKKIIGHDDKLMVVAEPFGLLVIETNCTDEIKRVFPFDKCGIQVVFTEDIRPYRCQKVRLLNGTHTSMCMTGLMMGQRFVDECMSDHLMREYLNKLLDKEIIPTIELPEETVREYVEAVAERFENPFIHHSLENISMNSFAKWRTRILPTVKDFYNIKGYYPEGLLFSLASLIYYYMKGWKECGIKRLSDDNEVIEMFNSEKYSVTEITNRVIEQLGYSLPADNIISMINEIIDNGIERTLAGVINKI